MNDKFLSLLGMARRANRLVCGAELAADNLRSRKARAVFCASDISEKTQKELRFAAGDEARRITVVHYDSFAITGAVGQKTGVVAVTDVGFAKRLLELYSADDR